MFAFIYSTIPHIATLIALLLHLTIALTQRQLGFGIIAGDTDPKLNCTVLIQTVLLVKEGFVQHEFEQGYR